MSIDTYKLTSTEEPTDEVLSQLMREAAEEAAQKRAEATAQFFNQLKSDAQKAIDKMWDEGTFDQKKLDELRGQHLRTPYK